MDIRRFGFLTCAPLVLALTTSSTATTITTGFGNGADAEVREESATTNRGTNAEFATRVGATQNSVDFARFDVSGVSAAMLLEPITYRLTFGATNLVPSRITDTTNNTGNTGLTYYVLDPNHAGATWGETTITYNNAPGLTPDANVATKDYNTSAGNLTLLGTKLFRSLNDENHMPVGEAHDFTLAPGSPLHLAIAAAQLTGHRTVTLVSGIQHAGNNTHANWVGFNYIFNSNNRTPLLNDNSYDNDVSAADGNEGSPYSCQVSGTNLCPNGVVTSPNNATDAFAFSPQLILVPEPNSLSVIVLGLLTTGALVRRRKVNLG
jgi:hypothetical protein